ncbi:hypothetical protein LSAT2_025859 [Lamellibrachia satsuma]|nr:hypothetical protein LSAT2_025859 [Lamellibrachia satsuma]
MYPFGENGDRCLPRITQFSRRHDSYVYMYTAFTCDPLPCDKCHVLRQKVMGDRTLEMTSLTIGQIKAHSPDDTRCSRHQVVDVSFYDSDTLSMLLTETHEDGCAVLLQLPLVALEQTTWSQTTPNSLQPLLLQADVPCLDIDSDVENMDFQRLEHMKAAHFAVSGTRKVACVLFASRRRVRLFLMDAEEEEEEEEDVTGLGETTEDLGDRDTTGDCVSGDDEDKENTNSVAVN